MAIIKGHRDENRILNQIQETSDNSASFCLFKYFEFRYVIDLITQLNKLKRW